MLCFVNSHHLTWNYKALCWFWSFRRAVLVKEPVNLEDKPVDIIPPDFAVRTLAQEYGGGAFAVSKHMLVFSNYKDQRLYKKSIGGDFFILSELLLFVFVEELRD